MRTKVCGITTLDDALAACAAGVDAIGFNFAEAAKSRGRYITPEAAERIVPMLPPFVTVVAVFVNPEPAEIERVLNFIDVVQLHGDEPPELCASVPTRVVKAFRAGPDFNPAVLDAYEVSAFLFDAAVPGEYGGTGVVCDWNAARAAVAMGKPVILAGGLTPENVADAIAAVRPYGVDTAGGVESAPGKKDHERIRDFVRNAHQSLSR